MMPAALWDLYVNDVSPLGVEFRRRCRTYNNTMAFTSIRFSCDTELTSGRMGVYTLRVQGMVYHHVSNLVPEDGFARQLQLYFYGTEHELENRLAQTGDLAADVIERLLQIVAHNPYNRFFRSMIDIPALASYSIVLRANPRLDRNVYNLPTVDQVAAIWNEGAGPSLERPSDIRVHLRDGRVSWVHYYYGCYDPLQYLLLFPNGDPGWNAGLPLNINSEDLIIDADEDENELARMINPKLHEDPDGLMEAEHMNLVRNAKKRACIAMRQFYCYLFQIRRNDKTNILRTGRLAQQFQIDVYVKIETQRLDFLRHNQTGFEMRSESYGHLVESLAQNNAASSISVGQRVHLAPSFVGGPRDMRRRYMNSLSLVSTFGRPDLFITMTCNPKWIEIQRELLPTEEAHNRADLLVRVFKAKNEELRQDLVKKSLFGEVAAYFFVVEFQKRGLPHVHWLIILTSRCVVKHMMHGPCGELNDKNVCMVKGKCKNFYPKEFCETTEHRNDSYPNYRRRDNGSKALVRGKWLDNRWVVPYNAYLLTKFDCHVNVQICTDIKSVKYLYKYCCKGHDQTAFNIVEGSTVEAIDEITNYQKSRWLCAPEAVWRIYGFDLFKMHPPVLQLHVHLPGYQQVFFSAGQPLPAIVSDTRVTKTQLTEFFVMNKDNNDVRAVNLLYRDFPEFFVWTQKTRKWTVRTKKKSIGRLVAVSMVEVERFYLRLLLNHVRAPTCFEDLMTSRGTLFGSFREAALDRGLLESDNDVRSAMLEAVEYQVPMVLRQYFSTILVHNSPSDPRKLWEEFRGHLSADLLEDYPDNVARAYSASLKVIDSILRSMGHDIGKYFLVDHHVGLTRDEVCSREYESEINVLVDEANFFAIGNLNLCQKFAFDEILASVNRTTDCTFFIDGPGGTGKTFLYKALLAAVRSKGRIALPVASSGVAASLLPNGRTAHSRFKIPLKLEESLSCSISKNSADARLIMAADLILWDEASMANRKSVESVDMLLRDLLENDLLFGGKTVVLGGDFRQTIPIVKRGSKEDTVAACLVHSALWPYIRKIKLVENMRAMEDPTFTEFLLRVGNGTESFVRDNYIQLPKALCLPYYATEKPLESLIDHVFPSFALFSTGQARAINMAILTPKNDCVEEINNMIIDKFPGNVSEYISMDYSCDASQQAYYQDFMNAVTVGGLPPHVLRLKINCPVMLLRNINPSEGLCNGTRLIVRHLGRRVIGATIAVGTNAGKYVLLPRIPLELDDCMKCPVVFKRHQYPIRLCFAMTINKSQGQTLDRVGVYLPQPVFSHGQLYVALSRVRTGASIKFLLRPPLADMDQMSETRNVVYKEILAAAG